MNYLPSHPSLAINTLARLFDDTSNSYKFLLFKAILQEVKAGKKDLLFAELALASIATAWAAIFYYHLNFGKADQLKDWITEISEDIFEGKTIPYHEIETTLKEIYKNGGDKKKKLDSIINKFDDFVPFRLLAPFWRQFTTEKVPDHRINRSIAASSRVAENNFMYGIHEIENGLMLSLGDAWFEYIQYNWPILEGWWRSNFVRYLQKRNPMVLAISAKLEPPITRDMSDVKRLFSIYFNSKQTSPACFYSKQPLGKDLSHDHFLPWSFLGSDPLYNFVLTNRSINSMKNDSIPHSSYLPDLAQFHFDFFRFVNKKENKSTVPYLYDLKLTQNDPIEAWQKAYASHFEPLMQTAINQGFEGPWQYTTKN